MSTYSYEVETPELSNMLGIRTEVLPASPVSHGLDYSNNEFGSPNFVQSLPEFVRSFASEDEFTAVSRDALRCMLNTLEKTQLIEMLCQSIVQSTEVRSSVAYTISSLATFRRLLVRNIAFSSTSEEVKDVLESRYGLIEEGTVVYDRNTGKSKGFAFMTFATVESACSAIIDSNNGLIELGGRQLLLKFAADRADAAANSMKGGEYTSSIELPYAPVADYYAATPASQNSMRKLFVYNLSPLTTSESLAAVFGKYGRMEECLVVTDSAGVSKRYAFVTFSTEDSAWRCLQEPNKTIDGRMTFSHLATDGPAVAHKRTSPSLPRQSNEEEVGALFNDILSGLISGEPSTPVEALWDSKDQFSYL
jgi:RNA recognition motif-containing protein